MKSKVVFFAMIILFGLSAKFGWFIPKEAAKESTTYKISGALEALNFWTRQRAYPNEFIPDIGFYTAFERVRQHAGRLNKSAGPQENWEALGPVNLGGRTLALAFNPQNPNTIYAGSASGGLWRSYTAGRGAAAWEYVPTGLPVLAVSSIAFAPDDSNTIYIGTGEVYNHQAAGTGAAFRSTRGSYGIGILKSTDGGQTWSKSLDWTLNQQRGVWVVRVNPLNPNTVWAGTTEGTYKSTDAGATWTRVHDVTMVMDLVIQPQDTNIVITGNGNFASPGHGIYRTTDSGATWLQSTQGLPETFKGKVMLDIYRAQPNVVFASIGNGFSVGGPNNASWLCQSVDSGGTWVILNTTDYSQWQGWYSHDVAVNPTNLNELFAIGIYIYKSTDGGISLQQKSFGNWFSGRVPPGGPQGPPDYSHVDHHDVVYHPGNPDIIYFANDGGVFRSIDGGETFEGCNGGYQTTQFYGGFSNSATDSLLAMGGLQDNATAIYDGQAAWKIHLIGGDGGWTAIDPRDPDVMYGSSQALNIYRSQNGGTNWLGVTPPGNSHPTVFIGPYLLGVENPDVIYGGRDIVYKSTDAGSSWTATNGGAPLDGNPVLALAISQQNSAIVYAATAPQVARPGVFRTLNGGTTWDDITADLPDRFPGDLAVDPTNDGIVYITLSGFGSSHVFRSETFGGVWEDIGAGLPDVPTSAVVVDSLFSDHIYVGNDIGVFVSTDGGATWHAFSEGLPDAVLVMDLSISPVNRKLRVATHGNGVYERPLLEGDITAVAEEEPVARNFRLAQNYPNPFNPTTTITYVLPQDLYVTLVIHNVLGEKVRTLLSEPQSAGAKAVLWDGRNDRGQPVPSGLYVYEIQAEKFTAARTMMLLK